MTVLQKKTDNPIAHLSAEDIELIGKELDTIRQEIVDSRGESDAKYIRRVIDAKPELSVSLAMAERRREVGAHLLQLGAVPLERLAPGTFEDSSSCASRSRQEATTACWLWPPPGTSGCRCVPRGDPCVRG